jgi:hypothetical protein
LAAWQLISSEYDLWMSAHPTTDTEAYIAQNASALLIAYWLELPLSVVEDDPRGCIKRAAQTLYMQMQRSQMKSMNYVIQVDDPKNPTPQK